MKLWTVLLAGVLAIGALDAEAARRLGGGGSVGRQSPNVTQRQATPPANTPTSPTATQAQRNASPAAAPTAAQPARRGFGGMLAGLAAGLGLAWLAHTLGFGEAFANILMFALLAVVVMAVIGMIMRRRQAAAGMQRTGGYAYQGAGATADAPVSPRQYNPAKVGNDASARPWEDPTSGFGGTAPRDRLRRRAHRLRPGRRPAARRAGRLTDLGRAPGFDTDGFLAAAKRNFVTLQDAWDRSDMGTLRSMMTDEMLEEIRGQMAGREPQSPGQKTEVVMLEAQLLGIEELATEYMASVEFSGMIREEPSAGPSPFREVWNMVKTKDGKSGWLVAGVQALQ
ncbi:Tim44 domain-containing protein [Ramlibacter montanisoli]|uniref:Tim44 domain-containing protein n=1 Tax=Ramlibacter montanisoli TaxID=2732512 RepID=UPI002815A8BB|nr:TIM44-like domain-containing protein [Ramlibacter montanisoli]